MATKTLERPRAEWVTAEDLMARPEDGVRRWIVNGVVKEIGMTQRNRFYAQTEARTVLHLATWAETQPSPRFAVLSGEAGIRFSATRTSCSAPTCA